MGNLRNRILACTLALIAAVPATAGDCGAGSSEAAAVEVAPPAIYSLARAAGFKTLTTAIEAAGLAEVLDGEGPFTVFAPTDEAFAKLPAGTVENLMKDPEALKKVLLHHVSRGAVMAAEVVKLQSAETLGGQVLTIDATDGVKVGQALVTRTDILARNGVIHVIDRVLMPEGL